MVHRLYLAGPITGCTYQGCTDWRSYVSARLNPNVLALSPMRQKVFLEKLSEMPSYSDAHPMSAMMGILCRDRRDVMVADAILFNLLGADRVSIGTMVEFGWADAYRKPKIVVMEPEGNIHQHGFVLGLADYLVDNLDAGIEIAHALLV